MCLDQCLSHSWGAGEMRNGPCLPGPQCSQGDRTLEIVKGDPVNRS